MKKRQKTLFASILVVLLLIVFLAGFTFAKYYTEYYGETSLSVAKWNFNITGWESEKTNSISLRDMYDENIELNTLAPGFSGVITLELTAEDSTALVDYSIIANENTSAPANMYFRATRNSAPITNDANSIPDRYSSLTELAKDIHGTMSSEEILTIKIYAMWPYEIDGTEEEKIEANKQDGIDAEKAEDYRFSLTVVGEQA